MDCSTSLSFLLLVLLTFASGNDEIDKIEFTCNSENVGSIEHTKNDKFVFQPLEYLPPASNPNETIGILKHELVVTGGSCFELIVRGKESIEIVKVKQQTTPITMEPKFKNLHLCQDIVMERFVEYNLRDPYQYREGDVSAVGYSMQPHSGQMKCYHRLRLACT